MIYNSTLNDYENLFNYCAISIVLFVITFLVIIGIRSVFIYFHWCLTEDILKLEFIKNINGTHQTLK